MVCASFEVVVPSRATAPPSDRYWQTFQLQRSGALSLPNVTMSTIPYSGGQLRIKKYGFSSIRMRSQAPDALRWDAAALTADGDRISPARSARLNTPACFT